MARIDLRKDKPQEFAAGDIKGISLPGIKGTLPLGDQPYVIPTRLTPAEEKTLRAAGWKPGDPVPVPTEDISPGLRQAVDGIRRDSRETMLPPKPLSTPPLVVPVAINEEDLSPERRKELADAIELGRRQMQEIQRVQDRKLPGVSPNINAAITGEDVTVINDVPPPTKPTGLPVIESQSEDGPKLCPHCNWPQHIADPIQVTDQDKRDFIHSLWGKPFQKDYAVMGGNMTIRIRSLRPDEVDLCHMQCAKEIMDGRLTIHDRRERLFRFRIALQLVRITSPIGVLAALPDSIDEWEADAEEGFTKLPEVLDYVYKNVLTSENLHRVVAERVSMFNSLCTRLEVHAQDADFYKGIE